MAPNAKSTKRALIWSAVSTRPQADEDEKFSIPKQISDAEAICKSHGLHVVDTLVVPGHSRSYRSLDDLASHARKQGIHAFDRLIEHLNKQDFDVFICRDANRFARKASLLHYIVETIVEDCGAIIYSMNDGLWVDEHNMDMWATMQGYRVRAEVKWLVDARESGLRKRAERGLSTSRTPFSHKLIRDEKHHPIRLEYDKSKRRFFDDVWRLVVEEKLPFNGIEKILYDRFGHVADDGLPYGNNIVYKFLYNPLTWGVTAYNYGARGRQSYGTWVFEETEDPPEGVDIHRNAIEPIYTEKAAELLKAELRRRRLMLGKRRPRSTSALSGLFICGVCGYSMAMLSAPTPDGGRREYAAFCNTPGSQAQYRPDCDQRGGVPSDYLYSYVNALLEHMVSTQDLTEIAPVIDDTAEQVSQIDAEIAEIAQALDNLILTQSKAHPTTHAAYQKRIDALGTQLQALEDRASEVRSLASRRALELNQAKNAMLDIAAILDSFWTMDPATINQYLHRLMGNRRFVVLDRKVIGVRSAPARRRLRTKVRQ